MHLRVALGRIDDHDDQPVASYRRSSGVSTVAVVAGLGIVSAWAWILTIRESDAMSTMVMGLGHIGRLMSMGMSAVGFLEMWAVMMVAMMAPTIVPVTLAYQSVGGRGPGRLGSTAALVVGYFSVWWLVGIPAFAAFVWFHDLNPAAGSSRWLAVIAGAIFLIAGAYQFTSRKAHCLSACCRPFSVAARAGGGTGIGSGFRAGWSHGVDCLGCCWAAMLVLLVVGLMHVGWMVGLALLFLAEKHFPRSLILSRIVGVALVVVGIAVIAHPALLPSLSGASGSSL